MYKLFTFVVCAGLALAACTGLRDDIVRSGSQLEVQTWPRMRSAIPKDAAMEARIERMVAQMTLPQKIGQMTQPEIRFVTPDEVRQYYIGSVLNGGGTWPKGNKRAGIGDWVALADEFYDASMTTDMQTPVPLIWGTDAMHGHGNAYGATLFPHNIGLGAARDTALIHDIGVVLGRQVRATGINWVFGPTVAVARDDRWGRTYESFSEDGAMLRDYARAYVSGMQGQFAHDGNVVATAKHFLGDGATDLGKDQGRAKVSLAEMMNTHAQGYYGALDAGVQTVMVSLSSWSDVAAGVDYGKMHGSRKLLTDVLKHTLGFDGFVVTDWNGISQVPGCSQTSCPQAINAGVDMVMVSESWRAFIANTTEQVRRGQIPMARIDDAVTRILRVKMRSGMFGKRPSAGHYAGKSEALQARELARRAVRESLVLLKNDRQVLPLSRSKRVLVVGKSAHSVQNQTGGWSLGWQGMGNQNSDFPLADSVLDGIREAVGGAHVEFNETAQGVDPARFDAVIAVIGETPYAEFSGDITPSDTLRHSGRYPEDLAVLKAVTGKGVPVITVMLSGRPVWVNDLLNLSDAFVAAWLPGTEGKGVTDVLFRDAQGGVQHDFTGRLSFSWPRAVCQTPLNFGDPGYAPLFPLGYGLSYRGPVTTVGRLEVRVSPGGCANEAAVPIFNLTDRKPYALYVSSAASQWAKTPVGSDWHGTLEVPAGAPSIRVQTTQINAQYDAKLVTWFKEARFFAMAEQKQGLRSYAMDQGALQFDIVIFQRPQGKVALSVECEHPCRGEVDLSAALAKLPAQSRHTVKVPLMCFDEVGADFLNVEVPFSISTSQPFSAAFTNIQIVSGAARDADALMCRDVGVLTR